MIFAMDTMKPCVVVLMLMACCDGGVLYNRIAGNLTGKDDDGLNNQDLGPPDHLDGVKFERDGHMNAEFHHEIFLGEEKHHFAEEQSKEKQIAKLEMIFHRADINKDNYVNETELQNWIILMVNDHMQQAIKETDGKFYFVGGDDSKGLTYETFNEAFMNNMRKKNATHRGKFTQKYITERLTVVKDEWKKADSNNDTILSKKEFLFFQHPEMSDRTLNIAVQDFLDERDLSMDQQLDVREFVFGFPVGEINLEDYMDGDELLKDKVYQFKTLVDLDGNGLASALELRAYMDPFSKVNARNDAHDMIFFVDMNLDQKLSFDEVKHASEYLTGTKLYDASSYFHNEL